MKKLIYPVVLATLLGLPIGAFSQTIPLLEKQKAISVEIKLKETHTYQIQLKKGEFLKAVIEQQGVDVVVKVLDPNGKTVAEIDSPNGVSGPELIELSANDTGTYKIQITPLEEEGNTSGRYEIKLNEILSELEYKNFLTVEDEKRVAVKKWLKDNTKILTTVSAEKGFEDLQPIKKMVADARIVSLGEATHGTREFFQLKHRMLEFLVTEMGFNLFGIEATMPEAFDINEYVLTGKGDPAKALSGLYFWTWDTEEVLEMIEWMRRYNADPKHTKKVKFYGFDMQTPTRATKVALEYLDIVDKAQALKLEKHLNFLANPFIGVRYSTLSKEEKLNVEKALADLIVVLETNKSAYIKASSENEWLKVRQHAQVATQYVALARGSGSESFNVRDRSMAENVKWILEHEGADSKIVLWAHNAHVATKSGQLTWMGAHLREMFGPKMVVFGFSFNQGSFQSIDVSDNRGLHTFTVKPAIEDSFDRMLADAGIGLGALDLRTIPSSGVVADWFGTPKASRSIGAIFNEKLPDTTYFQKDILAKCYDVMFFVEKTSAARATKTGKIPPAKKNSDYEPITSNDFEEATVGLKVPNSILVPFEGRTDFQVIISDEKPYSGKKCLEINHNVDKVYGEFAQSVSQNFDISALKGKKIKFRAAVRTEVSGRGNQAHLWLRVLKTSPTQTSRVFFDDLNQAPITSDEWKTYEIICQVPQDASSVDYGFVLIGKGKAWLDDVKVEILE